MLVVLTPPRVLAPFAPTATPFFDVATGLPCNTAVSAVPHFPTAFNAEPTELAPPSLPQTLWQTAGLGLTLDIDAPLPPHGLHAQAIV